jgi:hypothetical protein
MKFMSEELHTGNAAETESDDEAPMCEGIDPLFPKLIANEAQPEGESDWTDIEMWLQHCDVFWGCEPLKPTYTRKGLKNIHSISAM